MTIYSAFVINIITTIIIYQIYQVLFSFTKQRLL